MFKNVAAKFIIFAFDATTNVPKTGDAANITAYVSKDYGSVTVLGDTSATEMDATNAPGYYLFDAAQAETNADCLMVSGKSSTANIKILGAPAVIYTRPTTGWLAPTVAARTLDVTATGGAGIDWSNVEAPTTALALTGTTIAVTQKVDVDTIKTNPVVNGGTITFPTNATLASTTNITAGSISVANGGIATTSFAAGAIDAAAIAANAIGASELAQDAAQEIADEFLNRDLAGGASGNTRGVRNALRSLRNKGAIAAGTLTVYQEDDSTSAWTAAITTTAGNPISVIDPA